VEIECPAPGTHSYLHADHHSRYYDTTLGAATLVYSSGEGGKVALGGPLRCEASPKALAMPLVMGLAAG
jgi:hypothetical protein